MTPPAPLTSRWCGLTAAALAAVALAACGGDDDSSTTAGAAATATEPARGPAYGDDRPGTDTAARSGVAGVSATRLAVVAEESGGLRFDRDALRARAGEVVVALDNPSANQAPHAVEIEGQGVEEESATIQPGARTEVTAELRPGSYTFYCPVGDHRQQGMEGTLTVG